ncbi:MAG: hypothetical protein V3G42_08770 [Oscillospiraceae bacterium]
MTDKELKKLKRADLMELLYYMRREIDTLTEENQKLREDKQQLSDALNATRTALEKLELFSKLSTPAPPPTEEPQPEQPEAPQEISTEKREATE